MAHRRSDGSSTRSARMRMPLLPMAMRLPCLGRVTVTVRARAVAALLLLVALVGAVQRAAAVPFASLSPPPTLQMATTPAGGPFCVLTASGRGVSSISAADLAQFASQQCDRPQLGPLALSAVDLSNNSLTALPDGLFSALPANSVGLVDLSRNKFTAAGVENFRSALAGISNAAQLDLSFNDLGPTVPASVAQWTGGGSSLLLIGCGITDVPANAFAGSNWQSVDLSLNDLRSGLHANSFSSSPRLIRIGLSNCNLRSSSLVTGVFDVAVDLSPNSWSLYMDNLVADLSGVDWSIRFSNRGLSPKLPLDSRLLSFSALNSPGQPLTNTVTAARYLESWPNFFAHFPVGILYPETADKFFALLRLSLGDVASVEQGSLVVNYNNNADNLVSVTLAPQSVVAALGVDRTTYCPLHSLAKGLMDNLAPIFNLRIEGFDLPLPTESRCGVPTCSGCSRRLADQATVTLSTEPLMLQRGVVQWLRDIGLYGGDGPFVTLAFAPPPGGLWNPALNRSDWIPTDIFCDFTANLFTLPALPWTADVRMPFPPPAGLLSCPLSSYTVFGFDWRAARLFFSDMLDGFNTITDKSLTLDLESLYGGVVPVPFDFFSTLSPSVRVVGDCGTSCARIASKCPYFINGACRPCPPGSLSRARTSGAYSFAFCSASVCALPGHYCNEATSSSTDPIPCATGSYQPQPNQGSCFVCPAGSFIPSATECVLCPAGAHCSEGAVAPVSCPSGSEQPLLNQTSAASCTLCTAGKFATSSGTASCAECATGKFAGSVGLLSCQQCAAGQYQDAMGRSTCRQCSAGKFSGVSGTSACGECGVGKFAVAGSTSCTDCAAGQYQDATGQSSCQLCSAGSFNSASGSVSAAACEPCPMGLYCAAPGAAAPTSCPAGSEQPLLSQTSSNSCTLCAAGKFASVSGTANCAECATGRFAAAAGTISCSACAAGQYQSAMGQSACSVCTAGRFAAAGSSGCTPCATGSFAVSDGAGSCQQCTLGQYQDATGQMACRQCSAGSANSNYGSVSSSACQLCTPGRFAALPGSAVCPECAAGSYSTAAAQSACDLCPTGTYSALTGRSDPVSCANCPPGRFNPTEGGSALSSCQSCPPGRASNVPGVEVCSLCQPGYFNAKNSSSECAACPTNTYQSLSGATDLGSCTACPPDAPFSPPASTSLFQCTTGVVCTAGFYTTVGGTSCATPCPRGSACQGGVATPCAAGSYADSEGMGSCTPCGAGSVGTKTGSQSAAGCTLCPPSTFSSAAVSTACTPCAAGSFSIGRGAASASACVDQPLCATADSIAAGGVASSTSSLCSTGGLQPVALSALLPGGAHHAVSFLADVGQLLRQANLTEEAELDNDAQASEALKAAYVAYEPLRQAASLRVASFGTDVTLSAFSALGPASASSTDSGENSNPFKISLVATIVLVTVLLAVAFLPLTVFRLVPPKVAAAVDQFSASHEVPVGDVFANVPTKLGAVLSWTFLWVAVLAAVLLGLQDNTQRTTELLPPSATPLARTARGSWQITMRVYTGEDAATMALWCRSDNAALFSRQSGFSSGLAVRAVPTDASCSIAADCRDCRVSAESAAAFRLPYSAQLIEWELWVHSAVPAAWDRQYGVLTQLPGGRLMDAESELRFSVMESYFADERSAAFAPGVAAADKKRSGFEMSFLRLSPIQAQAADRFSSASTVTVSFALQKSDVVLRTRLSDKQTILQLLVVIASAVVSLFSIFAIAFRLAEHHVLRRLGWSAGPITAAASTPRTKLCAPRPAFDNPLSAVEAEDAPAPAAAATPASAPAIDPAAVVVEGLDASAAAADSEPAPFGDIELASPSAANRDQAHFRISSSSPVAAEKGCPSPVFLAASPRPMLLPARPMRLQALLPRAARPQPQAAVVAAEAVPGETE